jgi:hypothetical protein
MYPERHFILFTGHMIDKPDRPKPRFPASKEKKAREAISNQLKEAVKDLRKSYFGIAGGACGGDILFHESAAELNIPTALYLLFPKDEFVQQSVAFAGKNWIDRFFALCNRLPVHIMPASDAFPGDSDTISIWERSNRWMLDKSLQNGGEHMSLLALWNKEAGDGTGGTAHMAEAVKQAGGNVTIIDTRKLFDL